MSRQTLLEAAGLREADLAHPDARLPFSVDIAIWQLISREARDPGFGVRAGAALKVRDAGLVGYAMFYSRNLEAALRRLVRYGRILIDPVAFAFEAEHLNIAVARCHPALGAALPLAVDFRLAALLEAVREITAVDLLPVEVAFSYEQPAGILEHHRHFRCLLRFGQPESRIVLHQHDLALPISRGDETLAGYLSSYAEEQVRALTGSASFADQVRAAIWANLSEGRPTLSRIAQALQLPSRTLQRRLAEEGTSLQAEVETIRKAMALATLRDRDTPVEEVAFLLGYTEPSTFYRSFKRWTGLTPHRYRTGS